MIDFECADRCTGYGLSSVRIKAERRPLKTRDRFLDPVKGGSSEHRKNCGSQAG